MKHSMKWLFLLMIIASVGVLLPACSSDDDPTDPGGGNGDSTAPKVTAISPGDGQMEVATEGFITITFNEAMNPNTAPGEITLSEGLIFDMTWTDAMNLVVEYQAWTQAANVTVTVGTGLTDEAGNKLAAPVSVSYWTFAETPTVMEFEPGDGAVNVNRAASINLLFSEPMDVVSLETGITISDNTKALHPFTVTVVDDYRYTLDPTEPLAAMELTTVNLSTDVRTQGGDILAEPFSFSFTTSDAIDETPPTIESLDPPSGSTMPIDQTAVTIVFSEPMDTENFSPTMMNGQFAWLISQTLGDIQWNLEGTVLTVPLPANLPPGLPMKVVFAGYADANGVVQPEETVWTSTVAGTADPFPVSDGYRFMTTGTWAEGELGNSAPTASGEESVFFEFADRAGADLWERKEYFDPEYTFLDYYDILEVTAAGVDMVGFAEDEEAAKVLTEFFLSRPLTLVEFPFVGGNTWSGSATVTLPDADIDVTMSGKVVGQEDLPYGAFDGDFDIVWTGVWKVETEVTLKASGILLGTDSSVFWYAPGIGLVREMYHEEQVEPPSEAGWFEYDRWLYLNLN